VIDQLTDATIDTADTLSGLEALPGFVAPEGCSTAGSEDLRALSPARRSNLTVTFYDAFPVALSDLVFDLLPKGLLLGANGL
jgi:hypothetical protein